MLNIVRHRWRLERSPHAGFRFGEPSDSRGCARSEFEVPRRETTDRNILVLGLSEAQMHHDRCSLALVVRMGEGLVLSRPAQICLCWL